MTIEDIVDKVEKLDKDANYWFVRTDYGKLFEDFYKNNYIAIGWDYLTLYEFKNTEEATIKNKIANTEEIDINTTGGKITVSTIYNKINTFINLQKNDIVIIPSRNSDRLAFGRISDEIAYEDLNTKEFVKRRKVDWIEIKQINDLNPIFYQVKSNRHTISNINSYSQYIDRVMGNLFKKGEKTHYVLNIEKTDDIGFDELKQFIDNNREVLDSTSQVIDSLKMDTIELTKPFINNGN